MTNQYCVGIFILICLVLIKPAGGWITKKAKQVLGYFEARAIVKDVEQFEKMRTILK